MVGACYNLGYRRPFCIVADAVNWLGNGWLYLFLALVLLAAGSRREYVLVLEASMAAAVAHVVYYCIKRKFARPRPGEKNPQWCSNIATLDTYSFPSGHCMTASAVGMPVATAFPQWSWVVAAVVCTIAWARLVCAQHYPSDVLVGCILGAIAAFFTTKLLTWW